MNGEKAVSIRDVQLKELQLLKLYAALCDRHELRFSLYVGTLLGAVRHRGFIPWDDDLDVVMPLKDYQRFLRIAERELPTELYKYKKEDREARTMSSVLVAGGAGFIGAHLCRRLIEAGESIICLDDLSTCSMENLRDLMDNPRFTFMRQDVTVSVDLEVDRIYDLACPASPIHYQENQVQTAKTCVYGAVNLLELARRRGARILLTSTSEVYGEPLVHPQTEDYWGNVNPIGPRACYDEGKRMAETMFFSYHRQYGVDIRVVRIFNTYGPGMQPDDGRVISNFIMQSLQGEDITIYGDGLQTRCLCYVSDTVDALVRMMEKEGITCPVNIGNPREMTAREIASAILREMHSSSRTVYPPLPADDPTRRCPDITLARTLLGWKPQVSLEQGLRRTIK